MEEEIINELAIGENDDDEEVEEIIWKPFIWNGKYTGYSANQYCNVRNDETGYILTPSKLQGSGRERVHLHIDKKPMDFKIYRVGWIAFNGPIPEGMTIDHIDENIYNNHLSNLRLLSASENIKSYIRNHPEHGFQKLYPDETIHAYFKLLKTGVYYKYAATEVGISTMYGKELLSGSRRRIIWEQYVPFPDSAFRKFILNESDRMAAKGLILSGYSSKEILKKLDVDYNSRTIDVIYKLRKKVGVKDPKYFDPSFIQDIDRLILDGKSNQEIYRILHINFNDRISWLMARRRKFLGIPNNNFTVGSAEEKKIIEDMIKDGSTNNEILQAIGKERNQYYIDLFGKLRQKIKKMDSLSETIESIPSEKD